MLIRRAFLTCALCSALFLLACAEEATTPMTEVDRPEHSADEPDSSIGLGSVVYQNLPSFPFPPASAPTSGSLRSAALSASAGGILIGGPEFLETPGGAVWSFAYGAASNGRTAGQLSRPAGRSYRTKDSNIAVAALSHNERRLVVRNVLWQLRLSCA